MLWAIFAATRPANRNLPILGLPLMCDHSDSPMTKIDRPESDYMRKLRDPRWQKKRLEIMQRDDFTCRMCFETEKTLHVHHTFYTPGREPWEYPDCGLVTLCENCHQDETERAKDLRDDLITMLAQRPCFWMDFEDLCTAVLNWAGDDPQTDTTVLKWAMTNDEVWSELRERYFKTLRIDDDPPPDRRTQ